MYYLLTGQVPPEAPDLAAGTSPLTPPRNLRPDVSPHVQEVVFRAMAVNPEQRFQTAAEMRQALLIRFNEKTSALSSVPSSKMQASLQPIVSHLPWLAIMSGVGIALILGVVVNGALYETFTPGSTHPYSPVATNTPGLDDTATPMAVPTGLTLTSTPTSPPLMQSLITVNNVARLTTLAQLDQESLDLAWAPNGQVLALATTNGMALYEPITLSQTGLITSTKPSDLAFSTDSQSLLVGGTDNVVQLWNLPENILLLQLDGHTAPVTDVAIDVQGRLLASSSKDNSVRVWASVNGALLYQLKGHSDWVLSITFSPDGRWLASGGQDHLVRLWDVERGTVVHTFQGHSEGVTGVSIAPDGRLLASASEDGTVRLWDIVKFTEARILKGHLGGVTSVAFNPDGRLLATGSRDGTVRLWDVGSGVQLRTLSGHSGEVLSVIFDPDGRRLVSSSNDGKVHLWGVQ
jgi:WD40 repeat protein